MKLRLLSLIAVLAITSAAFADYNRGYKNEGYYLGGKEMHNRPMEKVAPNTYGRVDAAMNLGDELTVDPVTGEYSHFLGSGNEYHKFGNFLTPRD